MHKDVHRKVTHRMIYMFTVILSPYGTTERKTEIVAAKVGSNLLFVITFRVSQFQVKGDMLNIMAIT